MIRRPTRPRSARASTAIVAAVALLGLVTLPVTSRWYGVQHPSTAVRAAPSLAPAVPISAYASGTSGSPGALARILHPVSSIMGHDDLGRSLLCQVLPGALVSLGIGLSAAALALIFGSIWGATAALLGGAIDQAMMRLVDLLQALPYVLSIILIRTALAPILRAWSGGSAGALADAVVVLVAIGGVGWLTLARVVRGRVLSLKSESFVEAARLSGAGHARVFLKHIAPSIAGTALAYALLVVPQAILQESFLSFLGIGLQAPTPSLGRLAADGVDAVNTFVGYWWLIVFPCGVLALLLAALSSSGDALAARLDPKTSTPSAAGGLL